MNTESERNPADWRKTLKAAAFACELAERSQDETSPGTQALVADLRDGGETAPLAAVLENEAAALRKLADWLEEGQRRLLDLARSASGRPA